MPLKISDYVNLVASHIMLFLFIVFLILFLINFYVKEPHQTFITTLTTKPDPLIRTTLAIFTNKGSCDKAV